MITFDALLDITEIPVCFLGKLVGNLPNIFPGYLSTSISSTACTGSWTQLESEYLNPAT